MDDCVCVYGLWHLGSVTAACLAAEGFPVVGLDRDSRRIAALKEGRPPIAEPGLTEVLQDGMSGGLLSFTANPAEALARANVFWVTFDTPGDDQDRADVDWVRAELEAARPHLRPGTLVMISAQVPVGFTRRLEDAWRRDDPTLQFVAAPENLRLGQALQAFRRPERIVLGLGEGVDRGRLLRLFRPFSARIEWMSLHSAEMTKHALNGFLALSVAYANELARVCERVGADATEVERALRSEPRIGPRAYIAPGPPLAGATLLRDVRFLSRLGSDHGLETPLIDAVRISNKLHQAWARERTLELLDGAAEPRVALLGLTYKPGTDTLRRSSALELGHWLTEQGVRVRAFDPAICGPTPPQPRPPFPLIGEGARGSETLPPELGAIELADGIDGALDGSDVAVLATAWPLFRTLDADRLVRHMRHPAFVDQAGFLPHLADDPRVTYVRVGRPLAPRPDPAPAQGKDGG